MTPLLGSGPVPLVTHPLFVFFENLLLTVIVPFEFIRMLVGPV